MRIVFSRTATALAAVVLATAPLAACGDKADETAPAAAAAPSSKTLGEALKGHDGMGRLGSVVTASGLQGVLDGKGPYTVFGPIDAALEAGGGATDLFDESLRAQSVALVRAHTVPGALTRTDIGAAIDKASGGSVEMRTMAGGLLKFTRDGQTIVVTAPDGATGRLTGAESVVSNGVLQPVDGVLAQAAN